MEEEARREIGGYGERGVSDEVTLYVSAGVGKDVYKQTPKGQ